MKSIVFSVGILILGIILSHCYSGIPIDPLKIWSIDNTSTQTTQLQSNETLTSTSEKPSIVALPVSSLPSGTYTGAQTLTLSCATSDATIVYSLDNANLSEENGTIYISPLIIQSSCILYSMAYKPGYLSSDIQSVIYTIEKEPEPSPTALDPEITPVGGFYPVSQMVTLSCSMEETSIYYTVDGSIPSESNGILYSEPFPVFKPVIVKAIAVREGYKDSSEVSESYIIREDTTNWDLKLDHEKKYDCAYGCAVDTLGNLYVVAKSDNMVNPSSQSDAWIRKFDKNGVEDSTNWNKILDWGNNEPEEANTITIDSAGNVYVAGKGTNLVSSSSYWDIWIKKYNSNGVEYTTGWDKLIDGNNDRDEARDIRVAPDGSIYMTGFGTNLIGSSSSDDMWIKKFAADGTEDTTNWNKQDAASWDLDDRGYAIAFSELGEVYVGGSGTRAGSILSGSQDWWIRKFESNGSEITGNWPFGHDFYYGKDQCQDLAIDSTGNVYAVGQFGDSNTISNWHIRKFSSDGIEILTNWHKTSDHPASDEIRTCGIFGDAIYVSGVSENLVQPGSFRDGWIKKFSLDGEEDLVYWDYSFDGNMGIDVVHDMAIDTEGNIYLVGYGQNLVDSDTKDDIWIKKFNAF